MRFPPLLLIGYVTAARATNRGLAWATNNDFAPVIGEEPEITWYYHWENGPISQMSCKNEYVPMFWGSKKWDDWNQRKSEMETTIPEHLLGFNEPDVSTQANMTPSEAVDLWMQEIEPWAANGTKLGSPAIAWDLNWTQSFLTELESRGGHVDFICVHWYGSYNDTSGFQNFVASAFTQFNYAIWVTEVGVTTESQATEPQTNDFMVNSFEWMASTGYVDRAAWFGCFETDSPPDGFATGQNALFESGGCLSAMGVWYSGAEGVACPQED
ncbi:hypothetical protein B0H14DRAFT_2499450 [Mycena olivaceomarginata]|nr:hypothetical protein B0H14DRAFT_2499450 [Mycena olivaceomarginata]